MDIRISKGGTTWLPWKLTGINTNALGDNIVDPFERVEVANASGTYTIKVTHKETLSGGSQNYSLIVTGIADQQLCNLTVPTDVTAIPSSNSALISWNALGENMYDIQYQKSGDQNWTTVTAGSSPYQLTGLTELTAYSVAVRSRCMNGNTSDFSATVNFTTTENIPTYCSSYGNTANEYINRVQVGNIIDNTSGRNNGYASFGDYSVTFIRGTSYTATLTPYWSSTKRGEAYRIWIDYNRNGVFEDAEIVFSRAKTTVNSVSGTFSIPSTALAGKIRMRVSMKYNALPSACEVGFNGEVEDYTVSIPAVTNAEVSLKSGFTGNDVNELKMQEFTVYPNPASNLLNLSFEGFEPSSVRIFNSGGVLVQQKSVEPVMEISNLAEGFYIIELVKDNTVLARNRFIKKK